MTNHAEQIQQIGKELKDGEIIRAQAMARRGALEEQYNETNRELEALGIDPKESQAALEALTKEIEEGLAELESLIPFETIQKYRP